MDRGKFFETFVSPRGGVIKGELYAMCTKYCWRHAAGSGGYAVSLLLVYRFIQTLSGKAKLAPTPYGCFA